MDLSKYSLYLYFMYFSCVMVVSSRDEKLSEDFLQIANEDLTVGQFEYLIKIFQTKYDKKERKLEDMERSFLWKERMLKKRIQSLEKLNRELLHTCYSKIRKKTSSDGKEDISSYIEEPLVHHTIRQKKEVSNIVRRSATDSGPYADLSTLKKDFSQSEYPTDKKRTVRGSVYFSNLRHRRQTKQHQVAFFASVQPHDLRDLGVNQSIVFDHVSTNLGGAYHRFSGVFIASVPGTYFFSVTICGYSQTRVDGEPKDYFYAHLEVNGENIAKIIIYADHYRQASQTSSVHLNAGDEVTVKNDVQDDGILGDHYTTLTGFLLFEDDNSHVDIVGK